jgi:hypothetical protein
VSVVQVPGLVNLAAEVLVGQDELLDLFIAFLPEKAKPLLARLMVH